MAFEPSSNRYTQTTWQDQFAYEILAKNNFARPSSGAPSSATTADIQSTLENQFSELWTTFDSWADQLKPTLETPVETAPSSLQANPGLEPIIQNPSLLLEGSVDIDTPELEKHQDSPLEPETLTPPSKNAVNQLISDLSESLEREVHASVYFNENNAQLRLTAGTLSSVEYQITENTLYSAHTHPSGILKPTPTDVRNEVPGAEDAVVVNGEGLIYA